MATYGLTDEGLVIKTLPIIIEEKQQEIRSLFGDSVNVESESNFGQLIEISAEREYELWELLEQLNLSQYPSTASKGALDQAVALNGIKRDGLIFSKILDQAFWGTPGTTILAGTTLYVNGDQDSKYSLNDEVVLGAGVNQIQNISFSLTPDAGSWKITFRNEECTTALSYAASASEVKAALEEISFIDSVTVIGSMSAGFDVTFNGTEVVFRKNHLLEV